MWCWRTGAATKYRHIQCHFLKENLWISITISKWRNLQHCSIGSPIAWRRPSDEPLSEPMMVDLQMHVSVTRSQWVKQNYSMLPVALLNLYQCPPSKHMRKRDKILSYIHLKLHEKHKINVNDNYFNDTHSDTWVKISLEIKEVRTDPS